MSKSEPGRVVVIGSTNTDLIMQVAELPVPGETVGDGRFSQARGGKGANQALAARRSGASVTFVSVVGDDAYGREAREAYASEGIDVTHMGSHVEPTGTALIFVDQHGENCIGVAPGANARCNEAHIHTARHPIEEAAVVLMQLEIPMDSVREVLSIHVRGRVLLNAAPMLDLVAADLAGLDTLIVNETELEQIVDCCVAKDIETLPLDAGGACLELHALGVTNVVVTLGSEGVFLSKEGNQASIAGFSVDAVDTTGAGDTFCGALAARLAMSEPLENAVSYAQAAAALTCTQLGAQGAIPDESTVFSFMRQHG